MAERELREDGGHRREGEAGASVGREAEGEDGGHDHQTAENGRENREEDDPGDGRRKVNAVAEVAAVVHLGARAHGEREEGEAHRVEQRLAREGGEVGLEEEFDSLHGAGEHEAAHDEDEHHEEEERHQDLGDALDALFNAEVDDEGGGAEEGEVREHGGDVGGGEGVEGAAHHGRIVDDAVAHEGLNHVVDAPAAHHGVEGEHEEAREHGDVSDDAREGAAEPSEGACGACAYRAAHAHLADEKREADRHGEEDVGEHEDGAAVRASHVGKLPNGTETDGGACARENKPQAGPPY